MALHGEIAIPESDDSEERRHSFRALVVEDDGDDLKVAIEHQVESRRRLEQQSKIRRRLTHHETARPQGERSCTHSRAINTSSLMSNGFAKILQIRSRNSQLS